MIRIRFYRFVLTLPLIFFVLGMVYFFVDPLALINIDVPAGWLVMAFAVILMFVFLVVFACPRCGKSPYIMGEKRFGIFGSPFPQTTCSSCGFDISGRNKINKDHSCS